MSDIETVVSAVSFRAVVEGQTEIQQLYNAVRSDLDIRRFQVAMHDTLFMRRLQTCRNLSRIVDNGLDRQWPFEVFALHQLNHQRVLFNAVNRRNIGMIQGS